jgi:hypothetical protein
MATDPPATLRALFDDLNAGSSNVELAEETSVAQALKQTVGALEWTATSSLLLPKVAELLDIKLSRVFVAFWQKAEEVDHALHESRQAPDRTIDVSLYDCSTEATLSPFIEVRVGGKKPGKRIHFTVALPMNFKAVELRIRNGAIVNATAGKCEIAGSVKLEKLTLAKLRNPVTLTLGEGMLSTDDVRPDS